MGVDKADAKAAKLHGVRDALHEHRSCNLGLVWENEELKKYHQEVLPKKKKKGMDNQDREDRRES